VKQFTGTYCIHINLTFLRGTFSRRILFLKHACVYLRLTEHVVMNTNVIQELCIVSQCNIVADYNTRL